MMNQLEAFLSGKSAWAPFFIRLGLATVFVLFGLQKLRFPAQTTAEIQLLANFLPLSAASAINFYMGLLELTIATCLFIGYRVRWVGLIASGMTSLFFISFLVKYGTKINPDIFRDVGLTGAGLSLLFLGAGRMSLDHRREEKTMQTSPPQ